MTGSLCVACGSTLAPGSSLCEVCADACTGSPIADGKHRAECAIVRAILRGKMREDAEDRRAITTMPELE
jgi:hypothetical protein